MLHAHLHSHTQTHTHTHTCCFRGWTSHLCLPESRAGWGCQELLTHNLPDGDGLGQGGRLASACDIDPDHAESDFGSCGEILDGEATALHGFRVSRDPLVSYERGARLGASFRTFLAPSGPCPFSASGPHREA